MTETQATVSPNTFEHNFNVYLKKVGGKRADSEEENRLNMEVDVQVVNGDDFDVVAALLFGRRGSKDYIESAADVLKSMHFSKKFPDHQVKFRASGKVLATLPNVELNNFHLDIAQMQMKFRINAKGIQDGDPVGRLTEALNRSIRLEVEKAAHWSANNDQQQGLELEETSDKHIKRNQAVQRAKDKANKANNAKVRDKANPKLKSQPKAKTNTRKKREPAKK